MRPIRKMLIAGGAGFVGSSLALLFHRAGGIEVCVADNLRRRGSELNLERLREAGIAFHHADARCPEDLEALPSFDVLVDCAAEPSVLAGLGGSPQGVIQNNLAGTINCLELARKAEAAFVFISTSRVYPYTTINALPFATTGDRFAWSAAAGVPGFSAERGIAEEFPLDGARSYYGATKLAAELFIQEYAASAGMPALINRCGILAGPWQMGKTDQGVVTLWVASHFWKQPLRYIGFGGEGLQVRDMLHVEDLFGLLMRQFATASAWNARPWNVGGGMAGSCSLRELTRLCAEATGNTVPMAPVPETTPVDVRIYVTDAARAMQAFNWKPERSPHDIVHETAAWLRNHATQLQPLFCAGGTVPCRT